MDVTVDTSVLIAVIVNEPERAVLISLTEGAVLIAPASVHWEIGNALSSMLRRNRITLDQALAAIDIYYDIPIRFVEIDMEAALSIAASSSIYAYDAYLIRCAERYRTPLLTLDHGLEQVARSLGVEILEVGP